MPTQFETPTIEVINHATLPLGIDLAATIAAANVVVPRNFAPAWGASATMVLSKGPQPQPGNWAMYIQDTAPEPDAEGYHDRTPDGQPVGYVLVKPTTDAGDRLDVTFFHELFEQLRNPWINLWVEAPKNQLVILEVCDAVEETWYFEGSVAVSNFQFPRWFDTLAPVGAQLDFMKKCNKPFELLPGGYISLMKEGRVSQVFGSSAAAKKFALEDRRMRRTHRIAMLRQRLARSRGLLEHLQQDVNGRIEQIFSLALNAGG